MEVIKRLVLKAAFSKERLQRSSLQISGSIPVISIPPLVSWVESHSHKATIPQVNEFLFLQRELKFSVPAVKGYHAALIHVFSLAGKDLAANHDQ